MQRKGTNESTIRGFPQSSVSYVELLPFYGDGQVANVSKFKPVVPLQFPTLFHVLAAQLHRRSSIVHVL